MTACWAGIAWLIACLVAILGYAIGRAFQREEYVSMQLENIHLRGSLDREAIRARTAEDDARRLRAQISMEGLRRIAATPGTSPGAGAQSADERASAAP